MNFFRDTSINKKVLISPAIVVAALGLVLALAISGLNKQQSMLKQVHDVAIERTTRVNEFIALSERVQSDVFRIAVLHFMKLPESKIQAIHNDLEQGLSDLGFFYHQILTKWALDQEEKHILEQMKVSMDDFQKEVQQAVAAVAENPSFGILLIRSASTPFRFLREQLKAFLNYQNKRIQDSETISERTTYRIKTVTISIALFTALVAILITVIIGNRFISHPISLMTDLMQRLSEGDLSVDIVERDRSDEIGSMACAVEVFRKNAIDKRAAEEALSESEQRFRFLFQNTLDCAVILDSELNYIFANPAADAYIGMSDDSIAGKNIRDALAPFPEFRDLWIQRLEQFFEIEEPRWVEDSIKIGSEIAWSESSLVAIRDDTGQIFAIGIIYRDISKRKQMEAQKEQLIADLQYALDKVKTLSGMLPICSSCKKIRDDKGYWSQIEAYIVEHSEAEFSHGICPECAKKLYPDLDIYDD